MYLDSYTEGKYTVACVLAGTDVREVEAAMHSKYRIEGNWKLCEDHPDNGERCSAKEGYIHLYFEE